MIRSLFARQRLTWIALGAIWLVSVTIGLAALARYDNAPGVAAAASGQWPAGTGLTRDLHGPTLVMLAHPRCTCTRASLAELSELMTRARTKPRAFVVFIKPGQMGDDWELTDLWRTASRIPGVSVVRDDEGRQAARFGAETSGQTFLYDARGRLLFSGGTTGARGHAGDNAGRATLLALLHGETPQRKGSPVFGCPLFASTDARPSIDRSIDAHTHEERRHTNEAATDDSHDRSLHRHP